MQRVLLEETLKSIVWEILISPFIQSRAHPKNGLNYIIPLATWIRLKNFTSPKLVPSTLTKQ